MIAMGSVSRVVLGAVATCCVLGVALAGAAPAAADGPAWSVRSVVIPANLPPGGKGEVLVYATNLGDTAAYASSTEPVKISATLPTGITATSITANEEATTGAGRLPELVCEPIPALECEASSGTVLAYASLAVVIQVTVAADAQSGVPVQMSVSGGGAKPVSASEPPTVSSVPTKFGVERFEIAPLNADGSLDTQAGSHPFQLTTTIAFNQGFDEAEEVPEVLPLPKDQKFSLPPGLVGDPSAVPQCPISEFQPTLNGLGHCPPETAIGVAAVDVTTRKTGIKTNDFQPFGLLLPVYNLEPSIGEPARFGFIVGPPEGGNIPVYLNTSVRTGGDYGVDVSVDNISQEFSLVGAQVSLWGVPGDPQHDLARGECVSFGEIKGAECPETGVLKQSPFLTLPVSCSGLSNPLTSLLEVTSWEQPTVAVHDAYSLHEATGSPVGLNGCNRLPFDPSISVAPEGADASTPTGLSVGVHVDQDAALNPTGLAEADVKDTTVALPDGVQLNPAAADGLLACSLEQISLESPGEATCPEASKVATLEIKSPLLPNPLVGEAYLAAQSANPFGSLIALYLVARDPVSGVLVKVAGEVVPNAVTGQLVAVFENTPQLPFESLTLHFFGSDRAPLTTPASCGTYTTEASIVPSSENPPATPSSSFDITSGPDGSPCPNTLPFTPALAAGTTNLQAGAFTPLTTTISREDGNQNIQTVQLHMPPGLSGMLAGIPLCGEAQANDGTCGFGSQIGSTIVSVGLGGNPYTVTGGRVYLTGPYDGAPFGLSIVNPAVAGPFNLGNVVVRARIEVDPHTAAITITTNSEAEGYAIPHILDGIPLQIKHVNVTIERSGFTFNPTNCAPTSITGSVGSAEGASSPLSVPFQITNCANLKFAPKFAVSTAGRTSKAGGASLSVKLTYPNTPQGTEANIAKVKVDLPKQLPSRLTTLQEACVAKVFEVDPAGCPTASIVGHAKAITPILPVPLEGPAYFVSHGGEAFPSLIVVLQGYGVTVDLVGTTFISKAGITSSTFKTVPDVPVGSFELTLPTGKYSALAANLPASAKGSFCGAKLAMPTAFVAQNGAEIHESTPIAVEGCSAALSFTSSIKKKAVTLAVYAPAAGKITASGKGLSSQTKIAKGQEEVIFTLKQQKAAKLRIAVKVAFKPTKGKAQSKSAKLTFMK
jgi:hypothetical protein